MRGCAQPEPDGSNKQPCAHDHHPAAPPPVTRPQPINPQRTHHVRQVAPPVQRGVGLDVCAAAVRLAVDGGRNRGQLGDQVEGVLEDGVPVLGLVDAGLIGLCKLAVGLRVEFAVWGGGLGVGWGGVRKGGSR